MVRTLPWLAPLSGLLLVIGLIGCADSTPVPVASPARATQPVAQSSVTPKSDEHAHKPGTHGGSILEIGRDNYHAEAVFERGGKIRLYMLGKDEAKVMEVEDQTLTAYIRVQGENDASSLLFKPEPQPDDAAGKTSQFLAQVPRDLVGRTVDVTIPSIRIAGERFRIGFTNAALARHDEDDMPTKVSDEEERKLYLTAGGKYTEADIRANGNMTATQKFRGVMAAHDLKPRPGDRVCPITFTKANPKFTWIVGGKPYEFCCPPCVDEFVQLAKEKPEEVQEPTAYVKQ